MVVEYHGFSRSRVRRGVSVAKRLMPFLRYSGLVQRSAMFAIAAASGEPLEGCGCLHTGRVAALHLFELCGDFASTIGQRGFLIVPKQVGGVLLQNVEDGPGQFADFRFGRRGPPQFEEVS